MSHSATSGFPSAGSEAAPIKVSTYSSTMFYALLIINTAGWRCGGGDSGDEESSR